MAGQNDQSDSNHPGAWWNLMTPLSGEVKMVNPATSHLLGCHLKVTAPKAWSP